MSKKASLPISGIAQTKDKSLFVGMLQKGWKTPPTLHFCTWKTPHPKQYEELKNIVVELQEDKESIKSQWGMSDVQKIPVHRVVS